MALPYERAHLRPRRLTPSMLDKWQECGFRFAADEREKQQPRVQETSTYGLALGKAVHEVVATSNRILAGGHGFPSIDQIIQRSFNPTHFSTEEQAIEGRYAAKEMLANYHEYVREHNLTVLAVERFVKTAPVPVQHGIEAVLSGKIDVVLLREDAAVLSTDLKTGSMLPVPDVLMARLSSTAYHCLTKLLYPNAPAILISQVLLSTGAAVTVDMPAKALQDGKRQIRKLAVALETDPLMVGEEFRPTLGDHCSWCRYQDACPLFSGQDVSEEPAF